MCIEDWGCEICIWICGNRFSFAIMRGPTVAERNLMEKWIESFVPFVNDDQDVDFGTNSIDEIKVATPDGSIQIQDERWKSLVKLGEVFANAA